MMKTYTETGEISMQINEVVDHARDIQDLKKLVKSMVVQIKKLESDNKELKSTVASLKRKVQDSTSAISKLENKIR